MIGQIVIHKSWGEGTITRIEGGHIFVRFSDVEKKLAYPNAFNGFLIAKDTSIMAKIEKEINEKIEEDLQKKQAAAEKADGNEQAGKNQIAQNKINKQQKFQRANIAFKCNYCDGGKASDCIGFKDVCSDEMIRHNIQTEHHVWCSSEKCPCRHYVAGRISRTELEKIMSNGENSGVVCYESSMLNKWRASAGITQTGVNKGKPMHLMRVQANSLAVLTTREPGSTDDKRFIFAVFLVDEAYEGDNWDEGYVTTRSEFKIEMKPCEAQHIKFWDYYYNQNAPQVIKFGSGLHRYLSDEQAAQILRDVAIVKKGTPDEALAERFYLHFCDINGIEAERLLEPYGALKRLF